MQPKHNSTHHQIRGCHKDAQPFFFLLRQPLSDVWWLPTNRHRLPTNRHWLHTNHHRLPTNRHRLPTNRHRLPTNRHRLPTNRHRLPTNRHRLPTNRHRLPTNRHQLPTGRHHRAYWTLRVFFFYIIMATPASNHAYAKNSKVTTSPMSSIFNKPRLPRLLQQTNGIPRKRNWRTLQRTRRFRSSHLPNGLGKPLWEHNGWRLETHRAGSLLHARVEYPDASTLMASASIFVKNRRRFCITCRKARKWGKPNFSEQGETEPLVHDGLFWGPVPGIIYGGVAEG